MTMAQARRGSTTLDFLANSSLVAQGTASAQTGSAAPAVRYTSTAGDDRARWVGQQVHQRSHEPLIGKFVFFTPQTLTDVRVLVGFFGGNTPADAPSSTSYFGLRYSTVAGDNGSGNWRVIRSDGASGQTVVEPTGIASNDRQVAAGTAYTAVIVLEAARARLYIARGVVATPTEDNMSLAADVSTNLPGSTVALYPEMSAQRISAAQREIDLVQYLGVSA